MPSKTQRDYTEDDLALFARYQAAREDHQPHGCTGGPRCWVKLGPPGYTCQMNSNNGGCRECGSGPR